MLTVEPLKVCDQSSHGAAGIVGDGATFNTSLGFVGVDGHFPTACGTPDSPHITFPIGEKLAIAFG